MTIVPFHHTVCISIIFVTYGLKYAVLEGVVKQSLGPGGKIINSMPVRGDFEPGAKIP